MMNRNQIPASEISDDELSAYERKPRANPVYKGRSKFSPDEDRELLALVEEYGTKNWILVAEHMPNRNSRQCRERYLNYLDPNRNTDPWTEDEDRLLEEKYAKYGPRWVHMVKFFPHRTDAMIKNRHMVLQRRLKKSAQTSPPTTSESDTYPIFDVEELEFMDEFALLF